MVWAVVPTAGISTYSISLSLRNWLARALVLVFAGKVISYQRFKPILFAAVWLAAVRP